MRRASKLCSATIVAGFAAALGLLAATLLAAQSATSEAHPLQTAKSVFQDAEKAAAALPPLLSAREALAVAWDEEVGAPKQSLSDLQVLYATVHTWPTGSDTEVQRVQTRLRYGAEAAAIVGFAKRGKFDQSLAWLEVYDPGGTHQGNPGFYYSEVLLQMMDHGDFSTIATTIQQCVSEGDGFPFDGAATALDASALPEMERAAIAREGLQAAPEATRNERYAGKFLAEVHSVFPDMDGEVEDAITALLRAAHDYEAQHPKEAQAYDENGARLLALLDRMDPDDAQSVRAQYPAASTSTGGNGLTYNVAGGKIAGARIGRDPVGRLLQRASTDLNGSLADAAKFKEVDERFAALAGIANAVAKTHPRRAQQAADDADALLDKDVAFAETGLVADLAHAYQQLDESAKAAEIATTALDAADRHTQQIEEQFDISTPEGDAKAVDDMRLPQIGLTYTYNRVATMFPQLALQHAHACKCKISKPLILAKIAEGMTPAGAKAPY